MNAHPNYSEWTKEQKDEFAKERMKLMQEKNEKIKQRHAEVEADRIKAEKQNSSVTSNRKLPYKKVTPKDTVQSEETGRKCKSTREWDLEKYGAKNWEPNYQPVYKEYRSSHSAAGHQFPEDFTPENLNKSKKQYFNNDYGYNQHKNPSRRDDKRFSSNRRVNYFSYSSTRDSDSRDISHVKKPELTSLWKNNKYREQEEKELELRKWITNVNKSNKGNIVLENIIVPHGEVIDLTNINDNIIVPHGEVIDLTEENDIDSSNTINDYSLAITEETITVKKKSCSKFERYERSPDSGSYDKDVTSNTKPVIHVKELEDENKIFSKNEEYAKKQNESLHVSTREFEKEDHKNSNESNSLQCHFDSFNKSKQKRFENKGIQKERFIVKKSKEGRSVEFVNNSKANKFHSDSNYIETTSNTHEDGIWGNTEQTDIKWELSDEEYKDNKMTMRKNKCEGKSTKDKFRRRSKMAKSNEKNETLSDGGWSTVSDE